MSDTVDVVIRGERVFPVDRKTLAEEVSRFNIIARGHGKFPGEPLDLFHPNEQLSADVLATMTTVVYHSEKD